MASVAIIFEGENNTFLLQLRDEKTNNYPMMWGLFGGGIENNETPIQAAIREMKEELGIDIEDIDLKEGKDMKLFSKEEILKLNNIIPPVKKFFENIY